MNLKLYKQLSLIALLLANGMVQGAINLNINPTTQTGNSVEIGIAISGLDSGAAPSLSTYDLDLKYDSNQLSFVGAAFGDPVLGNQLDLLNFGSNLTAAEISSSGVVNLFELSFDSPGELNSLQADSFTLATLTFNVLGAGTSQFDIVINALGDADGNSLGDVTATSVAITTVPLPPASFMMFSGLFAVLATKRNRRDEIMLANQI